MENLFFENCDQFRYLLKTYTMRGWQMIMINQVITYGVFNDNEIEDLMSKSQHYDCIFVCRNDTDTELVHKLQTIYKEDSSRLRNDFKAIHGFLL